MNKGAARVILVVGVGRSGTSLAMQALLRIGASISRDLVPASEENPRGAFEDIEVRDRMRALATEFKHFEGKPRPPDWRENPSVIETEKWLAEHLGALATASDRPAVAVKFPLASVYLPIWYDAAARINLPLSVIWATRNAQDTIASLIRAYDMGLDLAKIRYLQRLSPLMEDLRPDALLLPYEGWADDPAAQIRILAEFVDLPLGDEAATLDDLFDPSINHGGVAAIELDPLTRQVDEMISGRLGRFGDLVGSEPERLRTLSRHLAATLEAAEENRRLRKRAEAAEKELARTRTALEAAETRAETAEAVSTATGARLVAAEERAEAAEATLARIENNIERIRARAETAETTEAEVARLRDACDALSRARDADQAARDDRAAALEAEIVQLRTEGKQLSRALKSARAVVTKKTGEVARMRNSRRWRFGDRLSRLYHAPRWRDLGPFRLVRSLRDRSR